MLVLTLAELKEQILKINKTDLVRLDQFVRNLVEEFKEDNPQHYYSVTYYLKNEEKVKENVANWRKQQVKIKKMR